MTAIDRSYGAVVYSLPDRLYLLVHHARGSHWDHPKGHPESGETPEETARREIGEETGYAVRFEAGFFTEASWMLPNGQRKIVGYFLGLQNGEGDAAPPSSGEILAIQWLPYADARLLITYETGKRVLDDAEKFISKAS